MLSFRCSFDLQMEMLSRQLDIGNWISEVKARFKFGSCRQTGGFESPETRCTDGEWTEPSGTLM